MNSNLSFQEFAKKYSSDKTIEIYYCPGYTRKLSREKFEDYVFLFPNEVDSVNFGDVLKENNVQGEKYVGIIGGVLMNFEYLSAIKSKEALFIDSNPLALEHLAFCMYHATDLKFNNQQDNLKKFLENINSPINREKSEKLFGRDSKGNLVNFSLYNETTTQIMSKGILNYYDNSENKSNWLKNPEYLKKLIESKKIKAFRDEFNSGSEKIFEYLKSNNLKNKSLVLYLSNAFLDYEKLKNISKNYKTNLKNIIEDQTIIYASARESSMLK